MRPWPARRFKGEEKMEGGIGGMLIGSFDVYEVMGLLVLLDLCY